MFATEKNMKTSKSLIRMFTQENFSVLSKHCLRFLIIVLLFSFSTSAFSQDWYISNSAGMILEKTFSRAALREPYALKIDHHQQDIIPVEISEYIDASTPVPQSFSAELHTLYENAEEINQRWILRYANGNSWIVLSVAKTDADAENVADNGIASKGFAEYYDESGLLIREDTFIEASVLSNRHSYDDEILLQSETWQRPLEDSAIHLWSDVYHYARTGALRSIERIFYSEETETRFARFSPLGPDYENLSVRSSAPTISSDFISDIINLPNANIEYVTDDEGRIIAEIYTDDEGNVIGELTNTWSEIGSDDRLASISWKAENDTRLIEYEYDETGNRLIERNYRDGILERLVRIEEDGEVEELYLRGILSLRALWKDGQKISEEYFHQNPRGNR
jgi:hypothetical protein